MAADVSIYGLRDMAGGMRSWCREPDFDGDATRRRYRGGNWYSTEASCRTAARGGQDAWTVNTLTGLRLVRPLSALFGGERVSNVD